jgi:pimeloyl-ACP methyl ester carboxylesterase
MPQFVNGSTALYFEEHGDGSPILLIAPGGMNSTVAKWATATINPLLLYATEFRLIAMDQRNAGRSRGPLDIDDPWGMYARDQLALMDHVGIDGFHVFGCCIGGPFALKLIELAPERVLSAVLQQPVGITAANAPLYDHMWRSWASSLMADRADIGVEVTDAFGARMWQHEFVLSVSREFVRDCTTPLLILPGTDAYHPTSTGREIGALARGAQVVEPWNDSQVNVARAVDTIRRFLMSHSRG